MHKQATEAAMKMKKHLHMSKLMEIRTLIMLVLLMPCMISHVWAGSKPGVTYNDNMATGDCQDLEVMNAREGVTYSFRIISGNGSISGNQYCAPEEMTGCDDKPVIEVTDSEGWSDTFTIGLHPAGSAAQIDQIALEGGCTFQDCYWGTACCYIQIAIYCDGSTMAGGLKGYCMQNPEAEEDPYGIEEACAALEESYPVDYNNPCCPESGGGSGGGGGGDGSNDNNGNSGDGSTDSGTSGPGGSPPPGSGGGGGGNDGGGDDDGGDDDDEGECSTAGNPINLLTGAKEETREDLRFAGPTTDLVLKRHYNSLYGVNASLGHGWNHTFGASLSVNTDPDLEYDLKIKDINGKGRYFKLASADTYTGLYTDRTSVEADATGYTWHRTSGSHYRFDLEGRLTWIQDTSGNQKVLTYDTLNRLETVTDPASGRSITFAYDADDRISQISGPVTSAVPDGIWVRYQYDAEGRLTDVIYPDGTGFIYQYTNTAFPNYLTEKMDRSNRSLASWTYDSDGRAITSQTLSGEDLTIAWGEGLQENEVTVTDADGVTKTYILTQMDGIKRILKVENDVGCGSGCSNSVRRYSYDEDYNIIQKKYANGRVDQFFDFTDLGRPRKVIRALGTEEERIIFYTYHPDKKKVLTKTEASVLGTGDKIVIWDYDSDGNDTPNEAPTESVHRKIRKGFSVDADGTVIPFESITTYAYNTNGQVTAVDGPLPGDQDKVVFSYDPATGDLLSKTAPLVGSTSYLYDAAGNPTDITDVNGVITTMTYDGLNRMLTTTRNGVTSSRTYTAEGQVDTVTDPMGRTLDYDYNAQGLLEKVTDPSGHYLYNGYDTQGRRIESSIYSNTNELTHYKGIDYGDPITDPDLWPGKPWKTYHRNPDDTADLETTFTYDTSGNLKTVTDANDNMTAYSYDVFNRLIQVEQPGSTLTDYTYDLHGNMAGVTDAEGRATLYTYDDMGRLVATDSPDTGITRYTYDDAGSLASKTQNNNAITYAYDTLGRLTDIHYIDSAEDVVYTYDTGTGDYLVGRLASMSDSSGTYEYSYDAQGRMVSQRRIIGTVTFTTSYTYDDAGNLRSVTYPTGQVIDYPPDAIDPARISAVVLNPGGSSQTLASGMAYKPFGPPASLTFGNGLALSKTFDKNYQINGITTAGIMDRAYTPDNVGNILNISDNLDSTRSQSFGYDVLYRLTDANGIYGDIAYTYDKVGNRLTRTDSQGTESYDYLSGTNKLRTVSGPNAKSYSYDADGNVIAALGGQQPPLADRADYTYNSNGQRVEKTAGGQTVVKHFDLNGQLIAETDTAGSLIKAYVWLHAQPLAQIDASGAVYYYHNDHLGTPQKMTDATGTVAWAGDYLPFGKADVTIGTMVNNLRFAGQYYDTETGLHYNYNRYYDPKIGRYLRADPIGIEGGINLFAYVANNPIISTDPFGLAFDGFHPEYPGTIDGCKQYCRDKELDFQSFEPVSGTGGRGICRCKRNGKWKCTASCNVQKKKNTCGECPDRVTGAGTGKSESEACKAAKKSANDFVPNGCYKRHCQCSCSKR